MIPFSILSCKIRLKNHTEKEVRILDLSGEGFTFRLAEEISMEEISEIELHFFVFDKYEYENLIIKDYTLNIEEKYTFYTEYRILTGDMEFQRKAHILMKEYMNYIQLKLDDDAKMSQVLTNYPAEKENRFPSDFALQKKTWFQHVGEGVWREDFELAISLDQDLYYEKFLEYSSDDFFKWYWKYHLLADHPLSLKNPTVIYVGNQFCHLLFPKKEILLQILEKAKREGLKVVVVFSYMQEDIIEKYEDLIHSLAIEAQNAEQKIELVINDWGMLSIIKNKKYQCFDLTLGVLLHKYRKDPRYKYKKTNDQWKEIISSTSVQGDFYREHLENDWGISKYSYESCGYIPNVIPEKSCLHLPFYQTNTSQHCTLYAVCHNGRRGAQTAVKKCPGYCKKYVFLYGENLNLVGRYNSLFGYDAEILKNSKHLHAWIDKGVTRVVITLL